MVADRTLATWASRSKRARPPEYVPSPVQPGLPPRARQTPESRAGPDAGGFIVLVAAPPNLSGVAPTQRKSATPSSTVSAQVGCRRWRHWREHTLHVHLVSASSYVTRSALSSEQPGRSPRSRRCGVRERSSRPGARRGRQRRTEAIDRLVADAGARPVCSGDGGLRRDAVSVDDQRLEVRGGARERTVQQGASV